MTYTITKNPEFNSIEILFEGKPSEEIRAALKALRFRWHNAKKIWYGYTTEEAARAAIEGKPSTAEPKAKTENKFGVKVGDIFSASWGYEQTNNDFFQVVELVGSSSVRVREVHLPIVDSEAVSSMAENRVYKIVRELLPACSSSVFIKDQERGDIKRLAEGYSEGSVKFKLASFASAYLCKASTHETYESWYY